MAALATIPSRVELLPQVLGSLRRQVDRLCVYLNGHYVVPHCVRELADEFVHDADNAGAEKKLHWAAQHDGIYLSCDDDLVYPPDYARTMCAGIELWGGCALVTAHGRTYLGRARNVHDIAPSSLGLYYKLVHPARFVNYGGSGVMAWDARKIAVPCEWPLQNIVDAQLAVWAQGNRVPIWLIRHEAHWLKSLAMLDPQGLYKRSQTEGHRRRNDLLKTITWQLNTLDAAS